MKGACSRLVRLSIAVKSEDEVLDREPMRLCRKTCLTSSSHWRTYATREFGKSASVAKAIV